MGNSQLEAIEQDIATARDSVAFGKAIERLKSNSDFKRVVMDGYMRDEAVRLVHLKGHPSMQSAESQQSIVNQIDAIGGLSSFFQVAAHKAMLADKSIADAEHARDEILAEDA